MLGWLVETTLVASILALIAGLAMRLGRLGPSARHGLWLVILLKLVTPPIFRVPLPFGMPVEMVGEHGATGRPPAGQAMPLWDRGEVIAGVESGGEARQPVDLLASRSVSVTVSPKPAEEAGPDRPDLDAGQVSLWSGRASLDSWVLDPTSAVDREPLEDLGPATAGSAGRLRPFEGRDAVTPFDPGRVGTPPRDSPMWSLDRQTLRSWLLAAWIAGSVATIARDLARMIHFGGRLARAGSPAPGWLSSELADLAAVLGVRAPQVSTLEGLGSPILWCAARTRLIVPAELIKVLDRDRWRGVLVHELAHLRRGDPWWSRLALVAAWVWWWNPLYWFVRSRLEAEAELACDAWVVWALPGGRRRYAEALVEVCANVSKALTPEPALGIGRAGRFLERRLTMILKSRNPGAPPRPALLAAGLLALLALPTWTLAQDHPAGPDEDRPRAESREREKSRDRVRARERERAARDEARARREAQRVAQEQAREADERGRERARQVEVQVRRELEGRRGEIQARIREAQTQIQREMREAQGQIQAQMKDAQEQIRKAQEEVVKAQRQLEEAEGDAREEAEERLAGAREQLDEAREQLQERMGELHEQLEERMREAHEQLRRAHDELAEALHGRRDPGEADSGDEPAPPRPPRGPVRAGPRGPRPPVPPRPPFEVDEAPEAPAPAPPTVPPVGPRAARRGDASPEAIEQLERRMDRLESKFDQLLEEIRSLKGGDRRDRDEEVDDEAVDDFVIED